MFAHKESRATINYRIEIQAPIKMKLPYFTVRSKVALVYP